MQTKLEKFIKRNRRRNKHLYDNNLTAGVDYIICPFSNERMSMIKSSYIEKVLLMTVNDYDRLYPGVRGVSEKRKSNIKQGLHSIDQSSGLTKYQVSQLKAKEVLQTIGKDGLSGYARKGQKTKQTHMNNIDEFGRNGYTRQVYNRLTTILPNGLTVEENAHLKQKETLLINNISGTGGASKVSKKKLKPILEFLEKNNIEFYFDKSEYGIKDTDTNNYYFYDLTILKYNIAIEYQSSAWHSNPIWDEIKWNSWCPPRGKKKTALESLTYDYNKAKSLYKFRNIVTYYVWEDSAENDVKDIICLLQTLNTKY